MLEALHDEMDGSANNDFTREMSREESDELADSDAAFSRLSSISDVILLSAKVYASIRSGSLAIGAATLDSLLDLLSGFFLGFATSSIQRPNQYRFPIGKKSIQPLGILVFASVMATVGLQIIWVSVRALISNTSKLNLTAEHEQQIAGILLCVTVLKLVLFFYCRSITSKTVKAHSQDRLYDAMTTSIGLIACVLANHFSDWIDPVGAILLAMYTIRTWSLTVLENVKCLTGRSASAEYLRKLTNVCWNHNKAIRKIDTVRAYTFGPDYFVEVDVVLPARMPLREAHDIGEALQEKLELLPDIARAFVHLDYECTHKPEHSQAHL